MGSIVFENVNKKYSTVKYGLEDINFTIKDGEFVFVIGRSGAGKSTLLKLISNQIKPTTGKIFINGQDINRLKRREIPYFHRQIGIMQQDFGLLENLTLYDNIKLAMKVIEMPRKKVSERVTHIMKIMGIANVADHYPHQVSQGEVARALLARAMIVNPSILVADEPTANLDPDIAWDIMCLLDELNRMGVTVIVVSHNKELVSIMRKRVLTLTAGRLVTDQKNAVYNSYDSDIISERMILDERKIKQLQ